MERSLLLSALALGCVGYACGIALTQGGPGRVRAHSGRPAADRAYLLAALLLPVLVFIVTLPARPPFGAGHGFGTGFAIGGVGALLAYLMAARALRAEPGQPLFGAAMSAGPMSIAISAVVLPQLLMRDNSVDSLAGIAIGWFCCTMIQVTGLRAVNLDSSDSSDSSKSVSGMGGDLRDGVILALVSAMGFAVTACAVAILSAYRGNEEFQGARWGAAATVLAAGVPFTIFLCSLSAPVFARLGLKTPFPRLFGSLTQRLFTSEDGRQAAARLWRIAAASGILLLLAKLLALRDLNQPKLLYVTGIGLLAGWIAWWLLAEGRGYRAERESGAGAAYLVPLAVLAMLGAVIVSFNLMAGFGVGAMVLAAWLAVGMAQAILLESGPEIEGETHAAGSLYSVQGLVQLLLFGVGIVLYRLAATRFSEDLRGVTLTEYYAIVAFLLGSVVPGLLGAFTQSVTSLKPGRQLVRLFISGALTLAIPGVAIILWKSKVILALLAGLALAVVSPLWNRAGGSHEDEGVSFSALLPALFALGVVLALSQWTHHALAFATLSREAKIGLLKWVIGGLIAFILAADYGERIAGRMRKASAPDPRPAQTGGGAQ